MFLNAGSGICKESNNAPLPIISIVTCRRGEYNRVTGFLLLVCVGGNGWERDYKT